MSEFEAEYNADWDDSDETYDSDGALAGVMGDIITLITAVAVAVILVIFTGVLSGQTYNLVEDDITDITNATIEAYITDSISSGFQALSQVGGYLPLIVLAIVISVVLSLVLGFVNIGGVGGGYSGGAML